MKAKGYCTLKCGDKTLKLPVYAGTDGPDVIDITMLYRQSGMFTYDPGYMSTASCKSEITYIDGNAGILRYRGYPIEQLAEHASYLEVCYLLLNGEQPTLAQKEEFEQQITYHTMVQEQMIKAFSGYRRDSHPMAILVGMVGALSAFYHDSTDINDEQQRIIASRRMIAKLPTIAAMAYKYAIGQPFVYPRNDLDYAANFLHMCFSVPTEKYKVNPVLARALDRIMILHADHEQNASTSTVRLAGSSQANPFAVLASGIASLWGPAHGGANEAVIRMLTEINQSGKPLSHFIERAKDKNDRFRLMGFGHRVYKNYDPRARIIRKICHDMLEQGACSNPTHQKLLDTAMELEQVALNDDYFKSRNLYPNVDFYSGIIFLGMGIPLNMFTVLFAVGRTVGWVAQWNEMMADDESKIGRPRQLYTGSPRREYQPIEQRS